jgi:hypothetical protein
LLLICPPDPGFQDEAIREIDQRINQAKTAEWRANAVMVLSKWQPPQILAPPPEALADYHPLPPPRSALPSIVAAFVTVGVFVTLIWLATRED